MEVISRSAARGVMLGAALGDALGAPYEGLPAVGALDPQRLADGNSLLHYTDDTAMTLALGESLVARGELDEDHLAETFARHWRAEPWRGYGRGTFELLRAIDAGASWRTVAPGQFGGQGSWGNGAAMRVSPVVLFAAGDLERSVELARRSAQVTHAHPLAIDGAAFQAAAIAVSLATPADIRLTPETLLARVRPFVRERALLEQLDQLASLVADDAGPADVAASIGCGVDARSSVPAAIGAVLLSTDSIQDVLAFAIAIGGDADTIASMAGAIAGAHHGAESIPQAWVRSLVNHDAIVALADALITADRG